MGRVAGVVLGERAQVEIFNHGPASVEVERDAGPAAGERFELPRRVARRWPTGEAMLLIRNASEGERAVVEVTAHGAAGVHLEIGPE